jgi:ketosteroid isomerase-like protein
MLSRDEAMRLFDHRRLAWLREDQDAYLACWADDMTFASPVHVEPVRGRGAYAVLVERAAGSTRPVRFDVHHLAVEGDTVLAEWSITVEHRTSGRMVCWDGMSVADYRDGLITRWREYWNPAALAALRGR